MTQESMQQSRNQYLAAAFACILGWVGLSASASAQSMSDYTNIPITINQSVAPNVLFLVDMGNYTLEAAYAGTGYYYPLSFKSPSTYDGSNPYYAANVTLTSAAFSGSGSKSLDTTGFRAVSLSGSILTTTGTTVTGGTYPDYTITNATDTFVSTYRYYGIFDPERCYTYSSNQFAIQWAKVNGTGATDFTVACNSTSSWDGNFLNWLAMRKEEIIQKVLVGGSGHTTPAQANQDGTANTLGGEKQTGENGASTTCSQSGGGSVNACWRYVKYVRNTALAGRVPTSLTTVTSYINDGGTTKQISTGMFFGVGEGKIYVNDNQSINPFDAASGNQLSIIVDLTSEPNVPSGNGSYSGTCDPTDPNFAGHRICYQRSQSLGIFQTMQMGNMHVGVMMVNASSGKGGSVFFGFDDAFNASVVATLRNEKVMSYAPLAESLYEALCLFRKSQGPCYNNSGGASAWGTNYTTQTGVAGDPFYFVSYGKMVSCCKNYVLMISPGIGIADGDNPDSQTPFPTSSTINPSWTNNLGVKASTSGGDAASAATGDRLDDVAFFGHTNDLRSDSSLPGKQFVTFYGVNALGRLSGATLLASAAKYGGFVDKDNNGTSNFAPTSGQTCVYPTGSNLNPGTAGPFYSDPEWDADADCLPDTFFDASDGYGLVAQIQNAINDILKKSSSGTSISVLASSSTGEGSIYQAYFYPETTEDDRKVTWTGYLQGLFIDGFGNLREDRGGVNGTGDGRLVYTDDDIIKTATDPTTNDVVVQRFADANGDGQPDTATPYDSVPLRSTQGIWEAGQKLALRDLSAKPRNLFTWVDLNNDGVVTSDEQMAFSTANATTLTPYLRAQATGTYTAANIISFLQGNQISGMRDRQLTVNGTLQVWRLGDIVNSSPTIVGPPRERFDILYGDTGYRHFLQRWSTRRLTAYVGANDGMLHAFNAGYYHRGDDPNTTAQEHGWYTTAPSDNNSGPQLGEELWGFIPHYILPQLVWYTQTGYTHVSYVDLKPKVTDVRIFTPEAECGSASNPTPTATACIHPDGWGTIMIIGLRFGGSCGQCIAVSGTSNGAPPLSVTNDFGNGTETRYFYSGYIVLDITNPDGTPKVLTAYSSSTLGLTTAYPTVVRMSPSGDGKNDHSNAKWMMVLGSGVHGYDGRAAAIPSMVGVQLVQQGTAPTTAVLPVGVRWGYMSDGITFDKDLDFRSDVVYSGETLSGACNTTASPSCTSNGTNLGYWSGTFFRLTMGTCTSNCGSTTWGVANGSSRAPTEFVTQVPIGGLNVPLGPMTASSTVTLDNSGNTWLFFGTGRYMSNADKTDRNAQYLVGVKDSVMSGCLQSTTSSCHDENLLDVTNAAVCISCASGTQVQGMGTTTTFTGLIDQIQGNASAGITAKDGWVIQLATNSGSTSLGAERSVVSPTLIGGAVFFPTFTPSNDVCVASGNSQIYGLYYLTGTGYTDPILGVNANGMAKKSISVGEGLSSAVAIQIGGEPTGMSGIVQTTNASLHPFSAKPPVTLWSQYLSWMNERG